MATIKAFTDIEQSRKLAEILPLESADMYYGYHKEKPEVLPYSDIEVKELCTPCWSLAALLKLFEDYCLQNTTDGRCCIISETMISELYDNPVDACVEMIIRLKEKGLL